MHIPVLENGQIGEKSERHGGEFWIAVIGRDIIRVCQLCETSVWELSTGFCG
tara:strand:- start:1367 stop:1522 length:156 start_codon:yes stop_codon:yes gene_type:complete